MQNKSESFFKVGRQVYLLDYWGSRSGARALAITGDIYAVDKKLNLFVACIFGDTYQTYSMLDYGRLVFPTYEEACKAAKNLPLPQTYIYLLINQRIYKRKVLNVKGVESGGVWDMAVFLDKGDPVSTKKIGDTLFYDRVDAEKAKKK